MTAPTDAARVAEAVEALCGLTAARTIIEATDREAGVFEDDNMREKAVQIVEHAALRAWARIQLSSDNG